MTPPFDNAEIALAVINNYPSAVRVPMMKDHDFLHQFNLSVEGTITFGDGKATFKRSVLNEAVSLALADSAGQSTVLDKDGEIWLVKFSNSAGRYNVEFSKGELVLQASHFGLLSADLDVRHAIFLDNVKQVNLPVDAAAQWKRLVVEKIPTADELDEFSQDTHNTPQVVRSIILDLFKTGSFSVDILVPKSQTYFDRLIGKYETGQTFEEFVNTGIRTRIESLIAWNEFEGVQLALLLGAHSNISRLIADLPLPVSTIQTVISWAMAQGDPMSRVAVAEAFLPKVPNASDLLKPLQDMISDFIAPPSPEQYNEIELFSSLFIFIDGFIANSRVLADKPPFVRRLAALAQAAMIQECIIMTHGDGAWFSQWALNSGANPFFQQSLVDLRTEPRWQPEYALPGQLKEEFFGRILATAHPFADFFSGMELGEILFGETDSLTTKVNVLTSGYPGPLEGGSIPPAGHPFDEIVIDGLSVDPVTTANFIALSNVQVRFQTTDNVRTAVLDALERSNHHIDDTKAPEQLAPILRALAFTCVLTRDKVLFEVVLLTVRKYRALWPEKMNCRDALYTCLIACAAHEDLKDWCVAIGSVFTDLAFGDLSKDDAAQLSGSLRMLCHLVPELWSTCGQADAAYQAVMDS